MLYFFSYNVKNTLIVDALLKGVKDGGELVQVMPTSYFVKSDLDLDQLYDIVRPIIEDNDNFIFVEIVDVDSIQGWLPSKTVDWVKGIFNL